MFASCCLLFAIPPLFCLLLDLGPAALGITSWQVTSNCPACDGRSLLKCSERGWVHSYARLHACAWMGVLACTHMCSTATGVRMCERERAQVQRTCVHAMQVCIMVCVPCSHSPPWAGQCALTFTRQAHCMQIYSRPSPEDLELGILRLWS